MELLPVFEKQGLEACWSKSTCYTDENDAKICFDCEGILKLRKNVPSIFGGKNSPDLAISTFPVSRSLPVIKFNLRYINSYFRDRKNNYFGSHLVNFRFYF